jgi:hypothetical protein
MYKITTGNQLIAEELNSEDLYEVMKRHHKANPKTVNGVTYPHEVWHMYAISYGDELVSTISSDCLIDEFDFWLGVLRSSNARCRLSPLASEKLAGYRLPTHLAYKKDKKTLAIAANVYDRMYSTSCADLLRWENRLSPWFADAFHATRAATCDSNTSATIAFGGAGTDTTAGILLDVVDGWGKHSPLQLPRRIA